MAGSSNLEHRAYSVGEELRLKGTGRMYRVVEAPKQLANPDLLKTHVPVVPLRPSSEEERFQFRPRGEMRRKEEKDEIAGSMSSHRYDDEQPLSAL